MKKMNNSGNYLILLLFLLCFFSVKSHAQSNSGPKFEFKAENNRIVLDTIYLDWIEDVTLDIEFVNKGDGPLLVKNVSGCCGTQITDWTKKPILPGENGTIKLEFRVPPRPHKISRTVRAVTNDPEGVKTLYITGVVTERTDDNSIILEKREY